MGMRYQSTVASGGAQQHGAAAQRSSANAGSVVFAADGRG